MHALDAMYHKKCLTQFYNRHISLNLVTQSDTRSATLDAIAFAELVTFIEKTKESSDPGTAPVFLLLEMTKLYATRLRQMNIEVTGRINSTKLKDRLLTYIPSLHSYNHGREVHLVCKKMLARSSNHHLNKTMTVKLFT